MNSAEKVYTNNINIYNEKSGNLKLRINFISIFRLVMVILVILIDYILYRSNNINTAIVVTVVCVVIFLFLVYFHDILFNERKRINILIRINENGLNRINGKLNDIDDGGNEYLDEGHPFTDDLDIFGDNSLFKIINTCVTDGGRKRLADILKRNISFNVEEILKRQEAIKEAAVKVDWRQKIIAEGKLKNNKEENIDKFIEWSKNTKSISYMSVFTALIFIIVTLVSTLGVIKGVLPESFILLDLTVNYIVLKIMSKNLKDEINMFESIKNVIISYSNILELMQEEKYESSYLKELQEKLILDNSISNTKDRGMIDCKSAMKKLTCIFSWIGNSRYNAYYFIMNVTLFFDIFLLRSMEKWRKENGIYLNQWIDTMYKIDEICSFANIAFEHEKWCYPELDDNTIVDGTNIGHPLLNNRCVKNSFSFKGNEKVALITGSNMSGKSTFLRTIGINMILSYTGSPVYADKFLCGIMNLYTCMRTKDNLEESISSFYAEILRIKLLIEAAEKGEKVFFLLDEIFKGTNSQDRHMGAEILIKQLIGYGGLGLVSTHDLELCDLEFGNNNIINYNFREFYENNKITFDYILRNGRSKTRNAIHLMRLAGIDICKEC